MKRIILSISLAGAVGAVQAQTIDLAPVTAQIGDVTVPEYQTDWGTSNNWNDGSHSNIANVYTAMSLPQYDGSQGDLVSVTVKVSGAWVGRMSIVNTSGTNDTSLNSASLEVQAAFDIFNDYNGADTSLIEASGYANDVNYNAAMVSVDHWDNPALPIVITPGGSAADDNMSGSITTQTFTYSDPADLARFMGNGQWEIGCFYGSNDVTDASGGSPLKGHEAWAECSAEVIYTVNAPQTVMMCATSIAESGSSVTAAVQGDESCTDLQFVQTITCTGDLAYSLASVPECNVIESPSGTFTAQCNVTIPQNGSQSISLISAITGTDGSCTSQVTSMSCVTPTNRTLNADTTGCQAQMNITPPPTPPTPPAPPVTPLPPHQPSPIGIPTLSQWGLILLSGLVGLIGIRRRA